jgi:arabinose-5-phosphate isomerase
MENVSAYLEAARQSNVQPRADGGRGALERLAQEARETLTEQSQCIAEMAARVDDSFGRAVGLMYSTPGHVVITGMGKSGNIGRKVAATLASTGTPSFFLHPAEAFHGDLGMITERDTLLLISYSGETEEVVRLLPHLLRMGTPIISLVGAMDSTLAKAADVAIDVSVAREACPNNLAPTNSTLAAMAMGDALAVSLMRARQFGADDFARLHPGGSLGRRLLTRVKDVMHRRELPVVAPTQTVRESLFTITRGRLGLALVLDHGVLLGIVTDGDLRRAMQRHDDVLEVPVAEIMSTHPVTIDENALLSEAEKLMRRRKIKALVVVNNQGLTTGLVEIFDRQQDALGTPEV